jgi:rod shape-determining protein MreB
LLTLLKNFLSDDLLIELSESKVTISVFSTDIRYEFEPYIAIDTSKKNMVIAIGSEAKQQSGANIVVINPFKHSRSFVGDFYAAEKLLQQGLLNVRRSKFQRAPRVLIHQLEKTEGGLTNIELRILTELTHGIRAKEALIHIGEKFSAKADSINAIKARWKAINNL